MPPSLQHSHGALLGVNSRLIIYSHYSESDFAHWYRCYQAVCHVRALCSNGRRYRHNFFCIRHPLLDRVKIWLTSGNPFLPKFCRKMTHPYWFEHRSSETFDGNLWPVVRDMHIGHNGEPKPPSFFRRYHQPPIPPPPNGGPNPNALTRTNFATRAATWRIW